MADIEALKHKLQPDEIRAGLMNAGLFLAGWELLKAEVVGRVRSFFVDEFTGTEFKPSGNYRTKVLSRHKSEFEASLLWLVDAGALSLEQADQVRAIHRHRHEVAHELPSLLVEPSRDINIQHLRNMEELLGVLGRFWGHLELDGDPAFDAICVDASEIKSGAMLLMAYLVDLSKDR